MRKRKLFLVLLLALLSIVTWAQQKNYNGQHVSIKQTTGDSIQYDLALGSSRVFRPIVKNGEITWSFPCYNDFVVNNVKSIDFRSKEYDEIEVRKALIEFYHAMDGDNWVHNDNWCSDKPIDEWYGINPMKGSSPVPWVTYLGMEDNNLSGEIPECVQHMGPLVTLGLSNNNIRGQLPAFLSRIYSLQSFNLCNNQLTGTISEDIAKIPNLWGFDVEFNKYDGSLPEKSIIAFMDNLNATASNTNFNGNNFSGKIPLSIQKHRRFADFWPRIVFQNAPLDVSDLVIPAPSLITKDTNGEIINLSEIYKQNKYTLLYKWGLWCSYSDEFNQKLIPASIAYKDKGLEVIGFHDDLSGDDGLVEYLKNHEIPWRNTIRNEWNSNLSDSSRQTAFLSTVFTPEIFLVDQNGIVVFNSLMDEYGNCQDGTNYRNKLFSYLEEKLGPVEYNFYTSTDYSHDGEVATLQVADNEQSVDLVFVGEGFTDKDIDNGTYDSRMTDALNQFFTYEPYSSLRNRFNVYAVKTVSPNAEFFGNATHAIDENISKALEYASKVPDLIPDRPMHVVVIYNNASGQRSYCTMMEDNSFVCFLMDGVSTVLNHEAGGHGFGKLFDEYVETEKEGDWINLPEEQKTEMETRWTTLGWGANVDWRSNPTEVKWAKFISDERYADENIGVFEGSFLYQYGAYRPTENSMMRYNDMPFNAPSREEIYKRVMKESEGDGWTYDYEKFVEFDAPGRAQFVDALSASAKMRKAPRQDGQMDERPIYQRTAPPVFLKGTWRDALKGNKK